MRGRRPSPNADKLTRRVKPIYCHKMYKPFNHVFNHFDFIQYYRFFFNVVILPSLIRIEVVGARSAFRLVLGTLCYCYYTISYNTISY